MRLAVAGKGGAGKTTLSATVALLAARGGRRVVAVDADANPNLATALGLPSATAPPPPVPPSLVSRRRGGAGLLEPVDEVLDRYAVAGPDGIRLLAMGAAAHADEGCLCAAHAVVSSVLEDLGDPGLLVVVDMEASPEHLSRGTIRHVDAVLLVAEPYYRSLETVRRMSALVAELPVPTVAVVANKLRSPGDLDAVEEFCARHDLTFTGAIPWSDAVGAADRARVPVVHWPEARDVVVAARTLAASLGRITGDPLFD
ncbi:CO dehydrogenase maturation factor [Blastococcus colisei]|uniref:CO dehydrogenase maturation factor n=1 Tax=Blastococcus colisei TaxID=1564162 RepID=A0A543PES2_9ACTN|nr:AAA family ATPase [Blastococcus colisei]TQN42563.1 CO dehydrogenase maturation factor [Blastococcus colisei]